MKTINNLLNLLKKHASEGKIARDKGRVHVTHEHLHLSCINYLLTMPNTHGIAPAHYDAGVLALEPVPLPVGETAVEYTTPTYGLLRHVATGDVQALLAALERVAYARADTDIRYYLNGILLDHTNAAIVATDGHRLAHTPSPLTVSDGAPEETILPNSVLPILFVALKGATGTITLSQSANGDCMLQWGDCSLAFRAVDGKFPAWQRVIPRKTTHTCTLAALQVKEARAELQRIDKLRKAQGNRRPYYGILTAFTPNAIAVRAAVGGDDASATDDTWTSGFNLRYLLDALAAGERDGVTITALIPYLSAPSSGSEPIKLTTDNITAVVMPCRL